LNSLEEALDRLGETVHLAAVVGPASHTPIVVTGLDDATVRPAVGRYLVRVIAGAVQHDARLSAALLPTGDTGRDDVRTGVEAAVGAWRPDARSAVKH